LPPTGEPPDGEEELPAGLVENASDAALGLPWIPAPDTLVVEAALAPPAVVTDLESLPDPLAV